MTLTVTRVPHSGVLLGLSSQRLCTGPWFPNGAALWRAVGGYPGRLAGTSPSAGQAQPLRPPPAAQPTPAQSQLARMASPMAPPFAAHRAAS